ncbi:MAG: branched-chain amino acid aminotransferase, partial [Gammaproteobacteria bacterium]|nr:branched-chain amino acid aminotransferase [Gammaproteobacteria bacterium]
MAAFGSHFASLMIASHYGDNSWTPIELMQTSELSFHPGAHVLHYSSTCFEGLKAYRHDDGSVHIFRLDRHVKRMQNSAASLCLPVPPVEMLDEMMRRLVEAVRDDVPHYPSSLYLRPVLLGLDANIGSAAKPSHEALLYIVASPVGDYFEAGERPLRLWIEEHAMRTTPQFGEVKTGGNYASALQHFMRAKKKYAVDQVLFCPGGDVQETGAANFLLINNDCVLTKRLDGSILPGITRASLLQLAATSGYRVEERDITVEEMLQFVENGEAALSGTAAMLAGVGELLRGDEVHKVNGGEIGDNTRRLRRMLADI